MTDNTTTPSEENEAEELKTPQTFEELAETVEILRTLPPMVSAEDMTISQSINYGLVFDIILDKQQKIREKTEAKDTQSVAFLIAEIIETEANLFRDLSKSSKKFDEWGKGIAPNDLYLAFGALMNFYMEQLGKSSASKKQSKPTA